MIVYDLSCPDGHRFEGWFGSSKDYDSQSTSGLLCCPQCGSSAIEKAPMAPAVPKKGSQIAIRGKPAEMMPDTPDSSVAGQALASGKAPSEMLKAPELRKAMDKLASMQAEALKNSEWVGDKFADVSRAIHYGEKDAKPIHGQATVKQAQQLEDEGIAVSPLPFPIAPPDDIN